MNELHVVASTLFTLALATVITAHAARADDVDEVLRTELNRISQRRIFFGHQSVGGNLLDGIRQLSVTANVPLRMVETSGTSSVQSATFGHALLAQNGEPLQKLRNFEAAFGNQPSGIDIALVKFCYVDITANTDVKALFNHYITTITALKAKNPGTTFIHVTVPLTTVQDGVKGGIKRLLGRPPYGFIENMRREEYNTLLRLAYRGRESVFDLARAESTKPNGQAETVAWNGDIVPAMVAEYSDDSGHLNATGKLRAAREFISVLAAIPVHAAADSPVSEH